MPYPGLTQPTYYPSVNVLTGISNGFPAIVTTLLPHGYQNGLIVRLRIPASYGMTQANLQDALVISSSPNVILQPTTFLMFIDTTNYDVFVIPPLITLPNGQQAVAQYAQVVPVGEVDELLTNAWTNVLTSNS
jgi:hypothetical protein